MVGQWRFGTRKLGIHGAVQLHRQWRSARLHGVSPFWSSLWGFRSRRRLVAVVRTPEFPRAADRATAEPLPELRPKCHSGDEDDGGKWQRQSAATICRNVEVPQRASRRHPILGLRQRDFRRLRQHLLRCCIQKRGLRACGEDALLACDADSGGAIRTVRRCQQRDPDLEFRWRISRLFD